MERAAAQDPYLAKLVDMESRGLQLNERDEKRMQSARVSASLRDRDYQTWTGMQSGRCDALGHSPADYAEMLANGIRRHKIREMQDRARREGWS